MISQIVELMGVPFGYLFKVIYSLSGNYLLSIILFCCVIKLCTFPITINQQKMMSKQKRLQPKENALREKYKNKTDTKSMEKMNQEMMQLYKENDYHPFRSIIPMLIQLPVLFSLYTIVTKPLTFLCGMGKSQINELLAVLHNQLSVDGNISQIELCSYLRQNATIFSPYLGETKIPDFMVFNNMIDLSRVPSITHLSLVVLIPILTFITSYLTMFIREKVNKIHQDNSEGNEIDASVKYIQYLTPLMSVWICFSVPAIIGIYWIVQNIIDCVLQVIASFMIDHMEKTKLSKKNLLKTTVRKGKYGGLQNEY